MREHDRVTRGEGLSCWFGISFSPWKVHSHIRYCWTHQNIFFLLCRLGFQIYILVSANVRAQTALTVLFVCSEGLNIHFHSGCVRWQAANWAYVWNGSISTSKYPLEFYSFIKWHHWAGLFYSFFKPFQIQGVVFAVGMIWKLKLAEINYNPTTAAVNSVALGLLWLLHYMQCLCLTWKNGLLLCCTGLENICMSCCCSSAVAGSKFCQAQFICVLDIRPSLIYKEQFNEILDNRSFFTD